MESRSLTAFLLIVFTLFSVIDILTTYAAFSMGGIEINPLNPFNGTTGIIGIAILKGIAVVAIIILALAFTKELSKEKPFSIFDRASIAVRKYSVPSVLAIITLCFGIAPVINNSLVICGVL